MTRASVKLAILAVFIASASFLAPYQYAAEANCHKQPKHMPKPKHDHHHHRHAPPLPPTSAPAPAVSTVNASSAPAPVPASATKVEAPAPVPASATKVEAPAPVPTSQTPLPAAPALVPPTGETPILAPAPAPTSETPTPAPAPAPWYPYWGKIWDDWPHECGHLCLDSDNCGYPCDSCCDIDIVTQVGKCCQIIYEDYPPSPEASPSPP